jgi:hypothetical protein
MFKKRTTKDFIELALKKHSDKYDYTKVEYIDSLTKVIIICKTHGEFLQQPNNHIYGQGCSKCGNISNSFKRIKKTEVFIKQALEAHKGKYTYDLKDYKNNKSLIKINCPIHGNFKQRASSHLLGQGCLICGQTSNYKRSSYINKAKDKKVTFYIIRCFSKDESFYKIGITFQKIHHRYSTSKRMPYMYEVVSEVYGNAEDIWDLELSEKRRLKEYNYQPLIKFAGSKTECFTKIK